MNNSDGAAELATEEGSAGREEGLVAVLDGLESLGIVCHDNPDPDTLASAVALQRIATNEGLSRIDILYGGNVSHQQNRSLLNLLDIEADSVSEANLDGYDALALVDHSEPGENNSLATGTDIDIVIDHHSTSEPVGEFVDVREDYSSTALILVDYLRALGVEVDQTLATALLFAMRTETGTFLRNMSEKEYAAGQYLHSDVDMEVLKQLDQSPISELTLDAIGTAIQNRETQSAYLVANAGQTIERDALPQAADHLLDLEGVETVLVFGVSGGQAHLSARSTDPRVHVGKLLEATFGDVGQAGGHDDMAGAQISLGLCADAADDDQLLELVEQIVQDRFFEAAGYEDRGDEETE